MTFDWKEAQREAASLSDKDLVERAQTAACAFVVLWREADSRKYSGDLRLSVSILEDRIGIIVEGYRERPV